MVHRDLAPLDSIIQAAGRCNRHGENGARPGDVHLWHLQDIKLDGQAGESLWRRVYDAALMEVTSDTLGMAQTWDESDFLELTQRYFIGCRARQDQQRIDEQLAQGDLAGVESAFRLIPPIVGCGTAISGCGTIPGCRPLNRRQAFAPSSGPFTSV